MGALSVVMRLDRVTFLLPSILVVPHPLFDAFSTLGNRIRRGPYHTIIIWIDPSARAGALPRLGAHTHKHEIQRKRETARSCRREGLVHVGGTHEPEARRLEGSRCERVGGVEYGQLRLTAVRADPQSAAGVRNKREEISTSIPRR